jgi:hypothetical protein
MAASKVTYKDPHQLKPLARNPRTAKQIKQIAAYASGEDPGWRCLRLCRNIF